MIIITITGVLLSVLLIITVLLVRNNRIRLTLIMLALISLIPAGYLILFTVTPELADRRFWTYKAFYRDIQIGMTRNEVFSLIDHHYPESGVRQPPTVWSDKPEFLGFFMNPEGEPEPNCEGIFLKLDKDRVTQKEYSRD